MCKLFNPGWSSSMMVKLGLANWGEIVRDYLTAEFPNRWLGRYGPMACPPPIPRYYTTGLFVGMCRGWGYAAKVTGLKRSEDICQGFYRMFARTQQEVVSDGRAPWNKRCPHWSTLITWKRRYFLFASNNKMCVPCTGFYSTFILFGDYWPALYVETFK